MKHYHLIHLQTKVSTITVKIIPAYLIHLSTRFLFSISLITEFDIPTVLRTSNAFRWAHCLCCQGFFKHSGWATSRLHCLSFVIKNPQNMRWISALQHYKNKLDGIHETTELFIIHALKKLHTTLPSNSVLSRTSCILLRCRRLYLSTLSFKESATSSTFLFPEITLRFSRYGMPKTFHFGAK